MRRPPIRIALGAVALLAVLPATAPAAVPHTVQPGETLWTIAAANNLHTHALAVFNGLTADSHVVLGSTVQIPSESEALAAVNAAAPASAPAALLEPFASPTGHGLGRSGWVSFTFGPGSDVPLEAIGDWVDESYRAVAPKRLVATLPPLGPA